NMAKPTHDLAVKTGSYQAADGTTKHRWKTIGAVFKNDDGGAFLTISRTFNPAGMPLIDDRDTIAVSLFKIEDKPVATQPPPINKLDDDIPF
ncbi:hypothetical protein, partial [Candidatus Thioglobus sp.]|uniref:hypothetical protein n=1 Tax=Candidatus Thioglobus sp. TaxID=2026721 RepID=UPI00262D8BEB